ncbi:MAG: FAD:protein FMN transferase [Eubacterium sp.]|nr:FAD:protein FMN transferase [Eubacterium sp.]
MKRKKIGMLLLAFPLVVAMALLPGCGKVNQSVNNDKKNTESLDVPVATQEVFAMDTYMTLTGYGDNCEAAVAAAVEEIQRLDALFSMGSAASEIAKLNMDGTVSVSEDTAVVISQALELFDTTGGVFDISIYPVMELWGFTTDNCKEPTVEELSSTLEYVDASKIQYDANAKTVSIQPGQGIDLGGIAKGYTSDRVVEIFEEYGLEAGLIDLGGNVHCYSEKIDGSLWNCGIQDPDDENAVMCILSVKDRAVITSGGYERFFTDSSTGKTWHHIIDPATGYSADSGLISVTIVSEKGMLADGLSTSLYIMGLDQAIEYWRQYKDSFDVILVTEDRNIYVSEGISGSIYCEEGFTVIK